ncbi:MAG: hypothetical protein JOY99_02670 [Sphingomonadaceae bacterium]|nr:hypothetical protein [Sphingomonadaceae bacterium]
MSRRISTAAVIAGALGLAGCQTPGPAPGPAPTHFKLPTVGLERVVGKSARDLEALFGTPDQDMKEETARRMVFVGPACVLDAYLYPSAPGKEPVVTWLDARQPNGDDMDRASCVAALTRR